MPVKISRLPFKSLWNSEYRLFVTQVAAIIEKYQIDVLHLTKPYGKMVAVMPGMEKIKARELSNALSNKLHDYDTERDTLVDAIIAQVKTMGKLTLPATVEHVSVLDRFFDQHGRDIASANYSAETERLIDMLKDYDEKPYVSAAAEGLNLSMLFEQLRVVNKQFADLYLKRTEQDAADEAVDVRAIRTQTDHVLLAFFDAIEYCSSEYEDLNYTMLANELSDLIGRYSTLLKARTTRRHRGDDTSGEKPIE